MPVVAASCRCSNRVSRDSIVRITVPSLGYSMAR
jgi:hypothetical protein